MIILEQTRCNLIFANLQLNYWAWNDCCYLTSHRKKYKTFVNALITFLFQRYDLLEEHLVYVSAKLSQRFCSKFLLIIDKMLFSRPRKTLTHCGTTLKRK